MPLPRFPAHIRSVFALILLTGAFASQAQAGQDEDERTHQAMRVLEDIQKIPEQSIPDKLLDQAKAIIVIPDSLKVGLVFGGHRGHGLMAVKTPQGTWSQPVFVKLTGASVGFQAGVQSSDVVLVFRNDRSLGSIVNGKFTLGADASVAAGPVGRNAQAATDGQLKAEIWSWSRARGLFAGVALDGAVLSIDKRANAAVYGTTATPRAIFESRAGQPSSAVISFRDALEEATALARSQRSGDVTGTVTTGTVTTGTPTAPTATPVQTEATPQQSLQPAGERGAQTSPLK